MEEKISKREWNKTQNKASIIDAAERLFLQKGFENTSIDDVAKEAGLTKRTLYQYFKSKEDLFYAVALKGARLLTVNYEEALLKQGISALDKIRFANKAYFQFFKDYPGMFRLLNYRPANQLNNETSPNYFELLKLEGKRMMYFADIVNEGKSDGSINTRLDMKKAVFFAFFTAFSLLFAASASDKSMWDMLELDESEFLLFCFDLLADALK